MDRYPLGDIVLYLTPFNLFMFAAVLIFTPPHTISRTETQVETGVRHLGNWRVEVDRVE